MILIIILFTKATDFTVKHIDGGQARAWHFTRLHLSVLGFTTETTGDGSG